MQPLCAPDHSRNAVVFEGFLNSHVYKVLQRLPPWAPKHQTVADVAALKFIAVSVVIYGGIPGSPLLSLIYTVTGPRINKSGLECPRIFNPLATINKFLVFLILKTEETLGKFPCMKLHFHTHIKRPIPNILFLKRQTIGIHNRAQL